jgi:FkbM family methyltransferase
MQPALAAGARVIAFEPHPASFAALERHFAGDERVEIHELAIGDQDQAETSFFAYGPWTAFTGPSCDPASDYSFVEVKDGKQIVYSVSRHEGCDETVSPAPRSEHSLRCAEQWLHCPL